MPERNVAVLFMVGTFYCVVSVACVWLAKMYMSKQLTPSFLALFQQVTIFIAYPLLAFIGQMGVMGFTPFKPVGIHWSIIRKTWVVGLLFSLMIVSSFVCLKMVDKAQFDMAKGLTLLLAAVTSYLIVGARQNRWSVLGIMIVTLSFFLNLTPFLRESAALAKFGIGSIAALLSALHMVSVKKFLPHTDNNGMIMLYYTSMVSVCFLLVPVLIWELPTVRAVVEQPSLLLIWQPIAIGGLLINIATNLNLQFFSAVSANTIAQFKNFLQSVMGILAGDPWTYELALSLVMKLVGSIVYVYGRHVATKAPDTESESSRSSLVARMSLSEVPVGESDESDSETAPFLKEEKVNPV
ncbi:MAG: uncharacterized protein KVP18_004205 [Porospora cf. gigantea A]|uniref:uncharacterized protein n=1 Tax=Porospora cf. gigantea A TaxID=2853593 RepID=UPI0035596709|nr:MAG: hypothetical protein KVP18_004205 [Porospora cf. gigantea A]